MATIGAEELLGVILWRIFQSGGVGSYLKLGGQVVMWGHNLPPLVKIGFTDLPKPWYPTHPSPPPLFLLEIIDQFTYYVLTYTADKDGFFSFSLSPFIQNFNLRFWAVQSNFLPCTEHLCIVS